ncbi:MAG: hypothetical protein DCF25_18775 [Leptolyngbya foveolarum]|uniref:SLH domain-containing protein n=1 Tax=Leptolyngbya foveolarum TaxID=47253 RepID=A0A2W4VY69_9CYAN|nr:MAG: hypothetical protein DCF25_18775 [Leptolyngbya foveolarum]
MSLTSKLVFGLVLSLTAGLSASLIAPAILSNVSTNNSFASSFAQAQTAQAQTPPTQTLSFSDVSADYWAHDYIEGLAKSNIISGFGDGTFRPNDPVTRAQFAAILRQAFLTSQPTTAQAFKDVPAGYWATGAIAASRSAGFLSGYPDNTFKPNDRIIRVQALVSLANGLKYPTGSLQALASYQDADTVPNYARPSTAAAAQANLIVNYPALDQIAPGRSASRAEVAAFVYQALVKAGRAEPLTVKAEELQSELIATLPPAVNPVGFSKSGKEILTLDGSRGNLQVWNSQTGTLLREIVASDAASVNSAAISHDGTKVAAIFLPTNANTYQLALWTVSTGKQLWQKPLSDSPGLPQGGYRLFKKLVFSADDRQIIRLGELNNAQGNPLSTQLNFQDVTTGKLLQSLDLGTQADESVDQIAFSPDGQLLASNSSLRFSGNISTQTNSPKPRVDVWKINQNGRFDRFMTIPLAYSLGSLAFSNSGFLNIRTLPPTNIDNYFIDIWNLQTREQIGHTLIQQNCMSAQLNSNGKDYFGRYAYGGRCFGNIQTGIAGQIDDYEFTNMLFSDSGDYSAIFNDNSYFEVLNHGPDPELNAVNDQPVRIFSKSSLQNP